MARQSLSNVCRLLNEATKTVPVEQSFVADLKRSIELEDEKNKRKPSQTYKPSSMNCIRNMYYHITGKEHEESVNTATGIAICECGSDRHERIQKAVDKMKDNGMDCVYIDVADFVTSRGLTDEIDIVDKQGLETKLFHKEALHKWQPRTKVDTYHYAQGTAYSVAFGIDEVIFLYFNRDSCDMKAFMLNVTAEMKQDLIGKILECDTYVKEHKLPPKPNLDENPNIKKSCAYCAYSKYCSREES